jgi:hypothetical protein
MTKLARLDITIKLRRPEMSVYNFPLCKPANEIETIQPLIILSSDQVP